MSRKPRYVGRRRLGAAVEDAQPVSSTPRHGRLSVQVPTQPRPTDYGFPRVKVPASRTAALDDTQPIVGKVVDETPKPVQREGLAPAAGPAIPAPSTPFLNAGAPAPQPIEKPRPVAAPLGPDQSAQLSTYELATLGRPIPPNAPPSARSHAPKHGARSREFDGGFWRHVISTKQRAHAVADTLAAANDREAASLDERLAALEDLQRDVSAQINAQPLPRRIPGAALAAIEVSRRELVAA